MPSENTEKQDRQWKCPDCGHTESRHHNERERPFCDRCDSRDAVLIEMNPIGKGEGKILSDGGVDIQAIHNGERIPTLETIKNQASELNGSELAVTCPCGREGNVQDMFQCLYCEVWFCRKCAQDHFDDGDDSNATAQDAVKVIK